MVQNIFLDSKQSNKKIDVSILTSALLIVLGVLGIMLPAFSSLVAETWLALILISTGAAKFVYALQGRQESGFVLKILLSILYFSTGIGLLFYPLPGLLTLTLLLGSFFLTEGTFELFLAFRLRPKSNWTWVLVNGIITLFLGGLVWFQWPSNAPWLLGTLLGVSILFSGISRLMLSLNGRDNSMDSLGMGPSNSEIESTESDSTNQGETPISS
ncbi:HdeD family acid-resistance protein [Altericista sp. CCNU0014]|uniref:HdeD family acid-resistance protein n=1 Tax=Altericista sp. CCNU0014 TaxID=3082949 RepID=UPI00384A5178